MGLRQNHLNVTLTILMTFFSLESSATSRNSSTFPSLRPTSSIGHIERPTDPFKQVQLNTTFKVFIDDSKTQPKEVVAEVIIRQKTSSRSQLIVRTTQLLEPISENEESGPWREYQFLIPLTGVLTPLGITLVNAKGVARQQTWNLRLNEWETVRSTPKVSGESSPWSFSVQSAVTQIFFQQSFLPEISQTDLTGKINVSYSFGNKRLSSARPWSLSTTTYFTLLPLVPPTDTAYTARFFGSNLRLGYSWAFGDRWILGIHTGLYYLSIFPSQFDFGFRNMLGPQLFPTLSFRISPKQVVSSYFKYSPVIQYGAGLSFSNREIATGLSYSGNFWQTTALLIGLDLSQVDISLEGITILDRTVGFSVGLRY